MSAIDETGTKPAKLFRNGGSDALRLPAGVVGLVFRETQHLYVTSFPASHTLVVSDRPGSANWNRFFAYRDGIDIPQDYMAERPSNTLPQAGGMFDEEI